MHHHAIFLVLEVKEQKYYKNWTKQTVSVFMVGFIFYGISLKKLIHIINIWFYFVFGLFFEQDCLISLIIFGVYAKNDQNVQIYFKTETVVAQNWIDDFFLTLTVRGAFNRKDFKWKKICGYRVNLWKNGSFGCIT